MDKPEYDTCYECGCDVVPTYNPKTRRHHVSCTVCPAQSLGCMSEKEAVADWRSQWDFEWEFYSNKTIFTI